jgi:hypothetical protein
MRRQKGRVFYRMAAKYMMEVRQFAESKPRDGHRPFKIRRAKVGLSTPRPKVPPSTWASLMAGDMDVAGGSAEPNTAGEALDYNRSGSETPNEPQKRPMHPPS